MLLLIALSLLSFVVVSSNYFLPLVMLSSSNKYPLMLGVTTITCFRDSPFTI